MPSPKFWMASRNMRLVDSLSREKEIQTVMQVSTPMIRKSYRTVFVCRQIQRQMRREISKNCSSTPRDHVCVKTLSFTDCANNLLIDYKYVRGSKQGSAAYL